MLPFRRLIIMMAIAAPTTTAHAIPSIHPVESELVAVAGGEEPQVINLMDAITQSMKQIKVPGGAEKPPRKAAASKTEREPAAKKTAGRKRKSG